MAKKIAPFFYFSLIITSCISFSLSLLSISFSEIYKLLFLLPLSFALFISLIYKQIGNKAIFSISLMITIILYYVKLVIIPILLILTDFSTLILHKYLNHVSLAITLSVYEILIISIVVITKFDKIRFNPTPKDPIIELTKKRNYTFLWLLSTILILYIIILAYLDFNIIRQIFSLMIGTPENWYIRTGFRPIGESGEGVLGVMASLVHTFYWIIQTLIPSLIITWVIKRKGVSAQIRVFFVALFFSFMVITGTRIHSLEVSVSLLIIGSILYGKKITQFIIPIVSIGILLAFFNVYQKSQLTFDLGNISNVISSYFGGIQNVAASMTAYFNVDDLNFSIVSADIIRAIPYIGNLFDEILPYTSGKLFNLYIGGGESSGQIIPAISQGFIYFGFVFAPAIPSIFIYLALKFEQKAILSNDIVLKNTYYTAAIMLSRVAPSTNLTSGVQYIFYTCLIIVVYKTSFALQKLFFHERLRRYNFEPTSYKSHS